MNANFCNDSIPASAAGLLELDDDVLASGAGSVVDAALATVRKMIRDISVPIFRPHPKYPKVPIFCFRAGPPCD